MAITWGDSVGAGADLVVGPACSLSAWLPRVRCAVVSREALSSIGLRGWLERAAPRELAWVDWTSLDFESLAYLRVRRYVVSRDSVRLVVIARCNVTQSADASPSTRSRDG